MPVRTLIIDDSAVVRKLLTNMLSDDPDIEVVGTASDPYIARDKIKQLHPDVLTLDVEMPRMDGVTFLRNLMRLHPMPVIMVSSLTERGADVTLEALSVGAIDFVTKPRVDVAHTLAELADELRVKVKLAARARVRPWVEAEPKKPEHGGHKPELPPRPLGTTDRVIVIGSSTGGTEALRELLSDFPADAPGTLVTQHFPEGYSGPFARRLDGVLRMRVAEGSDGAPVLAGHVYIAPGGRHLELARSGARYHCRVVDAPPVNRHRPSVDVLFRSAAHAAGANAIGAILTGMGDDGARGLKELRDSGAPTVAQDEATSVVWGMPGSAVKLGAAAEVLPLPSIAGRLLALARRK